MICFLQIANIEVHPYPYVYSAPVVASNVHTAFMLPTIPAMISLELSTLRACKCHSACTLTQASSPHVQFALVLYTETDLILHPAVEVREPGESILFTRAKFFIRDQFVVSDDDACAVS